MRIAPVMKVCALAFLLAACGEAPDEGAEPETEMEPADTAAMGEAPESDAGSTETASGQAVYAANCAACHGETGRGEGPAAIGLEPPPSDLTDGLWATGDGSLSAIRNTITNGSPGTAMIAWQGTLTEAEIDAVAQHVYSFSQGGSQ
jgi:high-affinity iron transporter